MEFRQLRYFIAVAQELSFTRAAAICHVSQPPLSRQIALLEQRLGARLFFRDRHTVELTDAGRVFLEDAKRTLAMADMAAERAKRADMGLVGKLTLGFGGSTAYSLLPALVRRFHRDHPDVELALKSLPVTQQIEALRNREIEMGLLRLPVHDELVETQLLRRESFVAVIPRGHRLAKCKTIELAALKDCSFVAYQPSRGLGYHGDLFSLCRAAGFEPKITQETTPTEAVVGIVACGVGVAIVPEAARRLRAEGVVYRSLQLPAKAPLDLKMVDYAIAWLRDDVSNTARRFIATAQEFARNGGGALSSSKPAGKETRAAAARERRLP